MLEWKSIIRCAILLFLIAKAAAAISADELIAKNVEARGGMEKLQAVRSIHQTGTVQNGSTSMSYTWMAKRDNLLREELSWQGLTMVTALDGSDGWRVSPFRGRLDPERIAADEVKSLQLDADFDGPMVDYKKKGNTVEYIGTEDVDGTEAHKLKVTLRNGNVRYVYFDPDYFLEIRWLDQIRIRGALRETETDLGNYEQVEGVYFPFSFESGDKGQSKDQKITIQKMEVNTELNEALFHFPEAPVTSSK